MQLFSPKSLIGLVAVFFVSAGIAYFVPPTGNNKLISPDASNIPSLGNSSNNPFAGEPLTEACPLNGKLYTKSEKTLWDTRRPLLTMIENHLDSRPQSGLSTADITYEAVAEGGITRFMGVFYCGAQTPVRVGPVRSARIYFVNLAAEYNTPIYMHVGGGNCSRDEASGQCTSNKKAWALEELVKMGWRKPGGNDFDTIGDIGVPVMKRDETRLGRVVATEHTYMGFLQHAWKEAEKRGYTDKMPDGKSWMSGYKSWKIGVADSAKSAPATSISYEFWKNSPDFNVSWVYDPSTKTYLRNQAGLAHIDFDNKKQLSATNIIIQFVKEEGPLDEHKHMFYNVISSGTGYYFHNGVVSEIKWKKTKQLDRTVYTDLQGKEIIFSPGQFWISILPTGNKVVYN